MGDSVPDDHDPDALVTVVLGAGEWEHPEPYPFAVIIALAPGEKVCVKPRVCIYCSFVNGHIEYGDGVFAVRSECAMIIASTPFPQLAKALRLSRKDFSKLLNFNGTERPCKMVKNWHEMDDAMTVEERQLGGCAALRLLECWAQMDAKNETLAERMSSVMLMSPQVKEKATSFKARLDRFTKFCHGIDLKMKQTYDFSLLLLGMHTCIAMAKYFLDADSTKHCVV